MSATEAVAGVASPTRPPPGDAVAVLRRAGVDVGDDAAVLDVSRSHDVAFVQCGDGRRFVVKTVSRDARGRHRTLGPELFVYRLAGWRPGLAAVVPRPVVIDERRQVLALEAAPLGLLHPARCHDAGFPGEALARGMGRSLAALHAATAGLPAISDANWGVLDLPDMTPERWLLGEGTAAARLATAIVDDPVLAAVLRRARAAMRRTCLVHGDVKWDNAVLDPAAVTLFDWELSGAGDPAWDLGSALADTLSLTVRLRGRAALPSRPTAWVGPCETALLQGYGDIDHGLAERTCLAWVGRLLHLALECASAVDDPHHPAVTGLHDTARTLAGVVDDVIAVVRPAVGATP